MEYTGNSGNRDELLTVAALQFSPRRGEVIHNLQRIHELAAGVDRTLDVRLLVLPELSSTGYFFTDPNELRELAESVDSGVFCTWMRTYAATHNRVVVGGFAERAKNDMLYNSSLIALPDGSYQVYRKTHLFYKERMVFQPGDTGFFTVEWEEVRYGMMICYDWRFPESSRALALRHADIIAHPSNLVASKSLWGPTMSTRALENKVITVTANRTGTEEHDGEILCFSGESQITDMNGKVLAVAGPADERIITAVVRPLATRLKSFNAYNDIFGDRRPEMYI
jgi:predicted amidohydrolase